MADELSEEQIQGLHEAFHLYETHKGSGLIYVRDLAMLLRVVGHNPTDEESSYLFDEIDTNENRSIDFPEFLSYIAKKQRESAESQEEILEAISCFGKGRSQYLEREVVEHIIRNVGEELTAKQTDEFLKSIKYNDEGQITFKEFVDLIFNKNDAE